MRASAPPSVLGPVMWGRTYTRRCRKGKEQLTDLAAQEDKSETELASAN